MADLWLESSFMLVEIAVDPDFQRQGIGGRLHDRLLQGLPHQRAVLSTLQGQTAAHHLYRSRGWIVLLEHFFFAGVPREYQIMGLELRPRDEAG
jgi:GNAT superfamily N-acetyltransferase